MKNPLKMNTVEKRLLLGGIASSLIYHMDDFAKSQVGYPKELNQKLDPHLPDNGQIISSAGPPLALMLASRFKKNEKIKDLAFGATLYGIPNLVVRTGVNTAYVEGLKARSAARFIAPMQNMSKYVANNSTPHVVVQTSSPSKYVVTS